MEETGSTADFLPPRLTLPALREAVQGCRGCGLYKNATQAVFGEGTRNFKWEARGKRRIHAKPSWSEVAVVKPTVLVLLGAVASQGLLGKQFRVTKQRGELVDSPLAPYVTATIHPSAILRGEPQDRERALAGLVADLRKVAALL